MNVRTIACLIFTAALLPLAAQQVNVQTPPIPDTHSGAKATNPLKPPTVNTSRIWRLALQAQQLRSQLKDTEDALAKEQEARNSECAASGSFQLGAVAPPPGSVDQGDLNCVAKQTATTAPPPPPSKGQ